jgi:hypothetical protein
VLQERASDDVPDDAVVLTDSKNVARIFRRGSGDMALMRLALQALELALELNLDLNAIWVS